jgi:hypothetical protein
MGLEEEDSQNGDHLLSSPFLGAASPLSESLGFHLPAAFSFSIPLPSETPDDFSHEGCVSHAVAQLPAHPTPLTQSQAETLELTPIQDEGLVRSANNRLPESDSAACRFEADGGDPLHGGSQRVAALREQVLSLAERVAQLSECIPLLVASELDDSPGAGALEAPATSALDAVEVESESSMDIETDLEESLHDMLIALAPDSDVESSADVEGVGAELDCAPASASDDHVAESLVHDEVPGSLRQLLTAAQSEAQEEGDEAEEGADQHAGTSADLPPPQIALPPSLESLLRSARADTDEISVVDCLAGDIPETVELMGRANNEVDEASSQRESVAVQDIEPSSTQSPELLPAFRPARSPRSPHFGHVAYERTIPISDTVVVGEDPLSAYTLVAESILRASQEKKKSERQAEASEARVVPNEEAPAASMIPCQFAPPADAAEYWDSLLLNPAYQEPTSETLGGQSASPRPTQGVHAKAEADEADAMSNEHGHESDDSGSPLLAPRLSANIYDSSAPYGAASRPQEHRPSAEALRMQLLMQLAAQDDLAQQEQQLEALRGSVQLAAAEQDTLHVLRQLEAERVAVQQAEDLALQQHAFESALQQGIADVHRQYQEQQLRISLQDKMDRVSMLSAAVAAATATPPPTSSDFPPLDTQIGVDSKLANASIDDRYEDDFETEDDDRTQRSSGHSHQRKRKGKGIGPAVDGSLSASEGQSTSGTASDVAAAAHEFFNDLLSRRHHAEALLELKIKAARDHLNKRISSLRSKWRSKPVSRKEQKRLTRAIQSDYNATIAEIERERWASSAAAQKELERFQRSLGLHLVGGTGKEIDDSSSSQWEEGSAAAHKSARREYKYRQTPPGSQRREAAQKAVVLPDNVGREVRLPVKLVSSDTGGSQTDDYGKESFESLSHGEGEDSEANMSVKERIKSIQQERALLAHEHELVMQRSKLLEEEARLSNALVADVAALEQEKRRIETAALQIEEERERLEAQVAPPFDRILYATSATAAPTGLSETRLDVEGTQQALSSWVQSDLPQLPGDSDSIASDSFASKSGVDSDTYNAMLQQRASRIRKKDIAAFVIQRSIRLYALKKRRGHVLYEMAKDSREGEEVNGHDVDDSASTQEEKAEYIVRERDGTLEDSFASSSDEERLQIMSSLTAETLALKRMQQELESTRQAMEDQAAEAKTKDSAMHVISAEFGPLLSHWRLSRANKRALAATKIQALCRGLMWRQQLRAVKENLKCDAAARKLQAVQRGFVGRRQARLLRESRRRRGILLRLPLPDQGENLSSELSENAMFFDSNSQFDAEKFDLVEDAHPPKSGRGIVSQAASVHKAEPTVSEVSVMSASERNVEEESVDLQAVDLISPLKEEAKKATRANEDQQPPSFVPFDYDIIEPATGPDVAISEMLGDTLSSDSGSDDDASAPVQLLTEDDELEQWEQMTGRRSSAECAGKIESETTSPSAVTLDSICSWISDHLVQETLDHTLRVLELQSKKRAANDEQPAHELDSGAVDDEGLYDFDSPVALVPSPSPTKLAVNWAGIASQCVRSIMEPISLAALNAAARSENSGILFAAPEGQDSVLELKSLGFAYDMSSFGAYKRAIAACMNEEMELFRHKRRQTEPWDKPRPYILHLMEGWQPFPSLDDAVSYFDSKITSRLGQLSNSLRSEKDAGGASETFLELPPALGGESEDEWITLTQEGYRLRCEVADSILDELVNDTVRELQTFKRLVRAVTVPPGGDIPGGGRNAGPSAIHAGMDASGCWRIIK